jgi:hypothetical protein
MIELMHDILTFSFPEVGSGARCSISFRKTLRVPDDGREYPLPPGFERFPLRQVDDYSRRLPESFQEIGGIMLPMHRAEAMYIDFDGHEVERRGEWPCLVKIAAGKVNAVTGEPWTSSFRFEPQDHIVIPKQNWLDGFSVGEGRVRQFVAVPGGEGYSPEEQIWGWLETGGLQIQVWPMKRAAFERHFPLQHPEPSMNDIRFSILAGAHPTLGLGGRIRQKIHKNPYPASDWEMEMSSKCFVHLVPAADWPKTTGEVTPTRPPTAAEYTNHGLPWYKEYSEPSQGIPGSKLLAGLKSVFGLDQGTPRPVLSENQSVTPRIVRETGKGRKLREGKF